MGWSDDLVPARRRDFLLAVVLVVAIASSVVFWMGMEQTEARPLINPCGDGSCTTQTVRPGGFDPVARLSANGHQVTVSGHLDCTASGMHYVLEVVLEQGDVLATGHTQARCDKGTVFWVVRVNPTHGQVFSTGSPVEACATLRFYRRNQLVGSRDWCAASALTLVEA